MKYNLKFWVGFVIVLLAVAPFIYFHYRAEDILQYFDHRYGVLDAVVACAVTLPILLLISFNPAFARFCAKDPSRVAETISTARYVSGLVAVMLILSVVVWIL